MHLETMKPLVKYDELLDENSAPRNKYYETLPKNINSLSPTKLELETPEIQQQSQDLFETLQQLNMMKMQKCTKDAIKSSAFSKIGNRNSINLINT